MPTPQNDTTGGIQIGNVTGNVSLQAGGDIVPVIKR